MENKYEGIVKAVDSGVCLVIMPIKREDQLKPRYVKRIYLSLATARIWTPESMLQQGSLDSSIAWCSREFMRNLCIGKRVKFRIERTTSEGKSYGPVTIQGKDAALPAVSAGWAKDEGVVQASKLSPKSMLAAYMNWGIRAPSITPDADPIALEAKCFTERLVLHRYFQYF
ncbi:hypothetical protein C1H46_028125 [Malus baccata]|uniref:Uncharacterized protein n=1 Tax=Malus baccata TaxID=106549 RepID=A0A540LIL0_MALBA|nr:hypothetical protein C1H46_028125 [Malus baccata]